MSIRRACAGTAFALQRRAAYAAGCLCRRMPFEQLFLSIFLFFNVPLVVWRVKKTGWPAWTYCPARHPVLASPLFNPPILFPMHQLYLLSSSCFSFTSRLRSCCTIPCYAGTQSPSNSGFTRDFLSSTGSLCPLLIFFFLHCRASTGHGRSTLGMCESKKGETGIACRSLFAG